MKCADLTQNNSIYLVRAYFHDMHLIKLECHMILYSITMELAMARWIVGQF
jgi:hypothetical protein